MSTHTVTHPFELTKSITVTLTQSHTHKQSLTVTHISTHTVTHPFQLSQSFTVTLKPSLTQFYLTQSLTHFNSLIFQVTHHSSEHYARQCNPIQITQTVITRFKHT